MAKVRGVREVGVQPLIEYGGCVPRTGEKLAVGPFFDARDVGAGELLDRIYYAEVNAHFAQPYIPLARRGRDVMRGLRDQVEVFGAKRVRVESRRGLKAAGQGASCHTQPDGAPLADAKTHQRRH